MNHYKGCIVVQGSPNINYLSRIKETFSGYQLVHSCWEGDDVGMFDNDDIVVVSEKPDDFGNGNFYLQKKSTIEGMKRAKELGWNRALKWRSDMWCRNGDKLFEKFDEYSLNLYYWVEKPNGYIMDFFMEGQCDDIITLFDTELSKEGYNYPEFAITNTFFKNGLDKKAKFIGKLINRECDIYWPKHKLWFSEHKKVNWFKDTLPDM